MNTISNNKKYTGIFLFTIICFTLTLSFLIYLNQNYNELFGDCDAIDGTIDINNTLLRKDGYTYIDGEWNFYANKLIISDNYNGKPDGTSSIPDTNSKSISNLKCASYSLKIINIIPRHKYYINLLGQPGDYNVFVDGQTILCNKHHPGIHTLVFIPKSSTIDIVIEINNFSQNKVNITPMILSYETYSALQQSDMIIYTFLYVAFLFFIIAYIIMLFFVNKAGNVIVITMFTFTSSLYMFLDMLLNLSTSFATYCYLHFPVLNNIKLTIYSLFTLATLYCCCYYYNNHKIKKRDKLIISIIILGWIICLTNNIYTPYIIFCYIILFYSIIKCVVAIYKNIPGANQYSYSILCAIFGILFYSIKPSTKTIVDTTGLLPVCLIASIIFILIRFTRINNDIYTKKLIENYKETELKNTHLSLQISRVKPHFIYNTLGTIQYLCKHDSTLAEEVLISFAKYLRHNLDIDDTNVLVHFTEELEHIKNYLTIINHRYQGKINVIYNLTEKNFFVPTLSIATVIENAVNHGASKLEKGGNIILSTYKKNKNYVINVSNDGIPYNGQPMGVGLTSCIERIKSLQNGTFSIAPRSTNGTIVTIKIPMEENQ